MSHKLIKYARYIEDEIIASTMCLYSAYPTSWKILTTITTTLLKFGKI